MCSELEKRVERGSGILAPRWVAARLGAARFLPPARGEEVAPIGPILDGNPFRNRLSTLPKGRGVEVRTVRATVEIGAALGAL